MTISYNWLSEYIPVKLDPSRLSTILTSVGLEVESMKAFDEVRGGLKGLVIGEVLEAAPHPNADKLKLTKVNIGTAEPLSIVCGAPNVAAGQKVVVAPVGATIYPTAGEPVQMRIAKIRGSESFGMICAEDEIGLGDAHAGIMVLPTDAPVGMPASEYFKPYTDIIYEIGLTPNRADAMSHWGVARDVCAYLSHHDGRQLAPLLPHPAPSSGNTGLRINVHVENAAACPRYSGVCIDGITVAPSPKWLQERLKSIGVRPINNIVDITNFIQHETGQPLHAFDYDRIGDGQIVVRNAMEGEVFQSLDGKERKLAGSDLVIGDARKGMCIAGVFGGLESGVSEATTRIFLESAFFDPATIRRTSFRHNLRTDAATRFEKGIDISQTVLVLHRAAALIEEIAGGQVASQTIDLFSSPWLPKTIAVTNAYITKLSGKAFDADTSRQILESLGFGIQASEDGLMVSVPPHKRDVSYPADIVEEILRIHGLDNVPIPGAITITPSRSGEALEEKLKEKVAGTLVGMGYNEILTNSISNSKYFGASRMEGAVKLLNNLSVELDVLRPAMLPTALEVIAFNHNRKAPDLKLFEWGKTYRTDGAGTYIESNHLCLYLTGQVTGVRWNEKAVPASIYHLKGVVESLLELLNAPVSLEDAPGGKQLRHRFKGFFENAEVLTAGQVAETTAAAFDVRQPVFFANFKWDVLVRAAATNKIWYSEVPRFPMMERDLALVVPKTTRFDTIRQAVSRLQLGKLTDVRLFDVFESEKLGAGKKSMAVSFTFLDGEKTLTDKEVDLFMGQIIASLEKNAGAEIRR